MWQIQQQTYLDTARSIFARQPLVLLVEAVIWIPQDCQSIQFFLYVVS